MEHEKNPEMDIDPDHKKYDLRTIYLSFQYGKPIRWTAKKTSE